MVTVGKNILDNLTTGMYSDSKVIFREYIQNACDQIDLAITLGILSPGEGSVDIFADTKKRYISIKDNATGVKAEISSEMLEILQTAIRKLAKIKVFVVLVGFVAWHTAKL